MKVKSKDGKIFDLEADFIDYVAYKFAEKGFEIRNKYAFVRGFLKRWRGETIQKWIDKFEKEERKKFLGGILDIKLPF